MLDKIRENNKYVLVGLAVFSLLLMLIFKVYADKSLLGVFFGNTGKKTLLLGIVALLALVGGVLPQFLNIEDKKQLLFSSIGFGIFGLALLGLMILTVVGFNFLVLILLLLALAAAVLNIKFYLE